MQSRGADSEDTDDVIRQSLSSYKPGSTRNLQGQGFRRVCLQLFGMVGYGKSSLINSCLCVVHNCPFSNEAGAGISAGPFTTARKEYKLTDTVYIVDNCGLNKMSTDERLELSAQFRNLRSISNVDWEFELERSVNYLEDRCNSQPMDFIVPVLVFSIDGVLYTRADQFGPIIRDAFEITGTFPIVVLTTYKTENTSKCREIIEEMGPQHIAILNNYTTSKSARNADTDSKILNFLHMCLQEADRGIQKKQDVNYQSEFLKQATAQIKAEMKRHKELQKEVIARKQIELSRKENEINRKELELSHKAEEFENLKKQIKELEKKCKN